MQNELFNEEGPAQTQSVSVQRLSTAIPLKKEEPTERARRRIRAVLRAMHVPICAWSTGKDSSALVSLVLSTAKELKEVGEAVPPIVVVHSDTGVEQPEVTRLARVEMQRMRDYAKQHGLEFQAMLGAPTLNASFPVRVIGGRALPAFPDTRQDCTIQCSQAIFLHFMHSKDELSYSQIFINS